MPDAPAAQVAVEQHCARWNAGDRAAWSALFAPEVTFEDPVGAPVKRGAEAIRRTWDDSHLPGRDWQLVPTRIVACGDEAAVTMRNIGTVHGRSVEWEARSRSGGSTGTLW